MTPEQRLLTIAARQHGTFSRSQALACGLTPDRLRGRVTNGLYSRVHPGVYLVAGTLNTVEQRASAACLAAGPGALASHRTAAALWSLIDEPGPQPEVVVLANRNPRPRGVRVYRTALRRTDRTRLGPIAVTAQPVTLVHLAAVTDERTLAAAVDAWLLRDGTDAGRLTSVLRSPRFLNARGTRTLREIVADRTSAGVPESELERMFIGVIRAFRLPTPVRQHPMGRGKRADFAYPDVRVAIELDGRASHAGWERQRSDRERQNEFGSRGWAVIRFTWGHVSDDPWYVVRTVAEAAGLRPRGWSPADVRSGGVSSVRPVPPRRADVRAGRPGRAPAHAARRAV